MLHLIDATWPQTLSMHGASIRGLRRNRWAAYQWAVEGRTQRQIAQQLGLAGPSAVCPLIKRYATLAGISHDLRTVAARRAALRQQFTNDATNNDGTQPPASICDQEPPGEVLRIMLSQRLSNDDAGRDFALTLLKALAAIGRLDDLFSQSHHPQTRK